MKGKLIKGLSEVHSKYDAFFIDLWGVIHNGVELYPEAINVLENLNKKNKRFVLISNAPRPTKSVQKYLENLKMDKIFLKNVFTSGEAALKTLKKNVYGKKFYHLGFLFQYLEVTVLIATQTKSVVQVSQCFRHP